MTRYFLTVRPCVEITALDASGSSLTPVVIAPGGSGLLRPTFGTGGAETDLIGLVTTVSAEAYEALR